MKTYSLEHKQKSLLLTLAMLLSLIIFFAVSALFLKQNGVIEGKVNVKNVIEIVKDVQLSQLP